MHFFRLFILLPESYREIGDDFIKCKWATLINNIAWHDDAETVIKSSGTRMNLQQYEKTFANLLRRIFGPACVLAFSLATVCGQPVFQQAGNLLIMSNANVTLQYNLSAGTTDFYWQNSKKI